MRTKVWKDSLYLGTWVTPRGQVLDVGPEDLKYFHNRTKAMLATGKPIPWGVEHHDVEHAAKLSAAERIREWAQGIKGHLFDSRISKKMVPNPATGTESLQDVLELEMDVGDADKPLLENLKSVSPELYPNFRDRNGPASDDTGPYWPGQSIGWLAVTGVPVQYPQRAFDFSPGKPVSLSQASVCVSLSQATFSPLSLSADPSGHEHKGKGPGGGQFTTTPEPITHIPTRDEADRHARRQAMWFPDHEHVVGSDENGWHVKAYPKTKKAVSLSAGAKMAKPFGKKDDKEPKPGAPGGDPPAPDAPGGDPPADPMADAPGEDLEPGGPPLPELDAAPGNEDPAGDTALMMQVASAIKDLGQIIQPTPGMDIRDFMRHIVTAVESHKATKKLGGETDDPNAQDPNQPDANQPSNEPEIAQNPPIMMSGAIAMSQAESLELAALRKDKLTGATKGIKARLAALKARGIIDDKLEGEELATLKTVPLALSAARPGEMATNPVEITVRAWERLAKTGKAGMFAAPSKKPGPSTKPISDAVALSQAAEEVVDPPYAPDDDDKSMQAAQNAAGDELANRCMTK